MTRSQTPGDELPLLTFELARELGGFREFAVRYSEHDVERYVAVTGDRNELYGHYVPPAFAAIFGRQGYLCDHRMPGGGVLLGQEIRWLRPARLGVDLMIKSIVEEAREGENGRRMIAFLTTAHQDGERAAEVRIKAGWPK